MIKEIIVSLIRDGYSVEFRNEMRMAHITIGKYVGGQLHQCKQVLPLDNQHMEEIKLYECLSFCKSEVDKLISNLN